MAKAFKYPFADYTDIHGRTKTVAQADLDDTNIRFTAMGNYLVVPGTQVRLYVRTGTKNYYFRTYRFNPLRAARWRRAENSREHDILKNRILSEISGLNAPRRIKIRCYPVKFGRPDKSSRHDIVNFPSKLYSWKTEVARICSLRARIQHDIFGSSSELPSRRVRPQVAIEVVDTHAPETKAIEAMLTQSIVSPLLVIFAFVKSEPWFLTLARDGGTLDIRCVVYIWFGEVFLNDVPTGIRTQEEFVALAQKIGAMV